MKEILLPEKQQFPLCLLAQNTMNNNSEDVVKIVESNNVESTSNEQRQTNKPIVISRRRLLKAGVAGIPVVLTMAGVAPADGIQTEPSAASGLVYGGNKVYNRFYSERRSDGLVWTDHNGFVLQSTGGVISRPFTISTDSSTNGQKAVPITGEGGDNPPQKTFTLSITPPNNLTVNAYQHKTGVWYTDRIETDTSKDLLDYIKNLELTVTDESSNTVSPTVTDKDAAFTSSGTWYQTVVLGWSLDNPEVEQNYYLLPASGPAYIDSVNYSAKVSFSLVIDGYTYSYNETVTIPLKLSVSDIPAPTNDDHGI